MKIFVYVLPLLVTLGCANIIPKVAFVDTGLILVQPISVTFPQPAKFVYAVSFTNNTSPVKLPYLPCPSFSHTCVTTTVNTLSQQVASAHFSWPIITPGPGLYPLERTGRVVIQLYDNQTTVTSAHESIKFLGGTTFLIDQLISRGANGTVSHFDLHDEAGKSAGQLDSKVTFISDAKH